MLLCLREFAFVVTVLILSTMAERFVLGVITWDKLGPGSPSIGTIPDSPGMFPQKYLGRCCGENQLASIMTGSRSKNLLFNSQKIK